MKLYISVHDTRTKNKTSKGKVLKTDALEKEFLQFLSRNLHFSKVKEVTFNLTLCGKRKIQSLNKDYRSIDKVTDVLSFGVHDNLRPDKKKSQKLSPIVDLGDIFICHEVAKIQAADFGITFEQELFHLIVHGFLHLLGFDHDLSLKEEKIMESYEDKLVINIYKRLGY